MIGVGLKTLARAPIPKLPARYSPIPTPTPQKEIYTSKKISLKVTFSIYQKNQGLFFKGKKIKSKQKIEIILAQTDDGPLKWTNDSYSIQKHAKF